MNLSSSLDLVLAAVTRASWQAGGLTLAVLVLGVVLGKQLSAGIRYALWLVVFARLALPVVPTLPWSVPQLLPQPTAPLTVVQPLVSEEVAPIALPPARRESSVPMPLVPGESPVQQDAVPPETPLPRLALAWLIGATLLASRLVWQLRRLNRQSQTWQPIRDDRVRALLQECRAQLGLRRTVELWSVAGLAGPATCGVVRPSILLPPTLAAQWPNADLRLVLLHELTHVRRWDVLLDRLAALLVIVHWFNPLAWIALHGLRRERELACDAAVLARLAPQETASYGHVLLKVAEQVLAARSLERVVGVSGQDASLKQRILMIAQYRKPTRRSLALGSGLFLLLAVVGLTEGSAKLSQEPKDPPNPPVADKPSAEVGILRFAGICQDDKEQPLNGAKVVLYRMIWKAPAPERLGEVTTKVAGRFQFDGLPSFPRVEQPRIGWYFLVVTAKGRASKIWARNGTDSQDDLKVPMPMAATLRGRVTDSQGKPVAGALVWTHGFFAAPLEGVCSARTDETGHYAITDLTPWDVNMARPVPDGAGMLTPGGCYFNVRHPDYGHERPIHRRVPDTIDVTLQPAGILEGRVLDQATGQPAAGAMVWMQTTNGTTGGGSYHTQRTDKEGRYRFTSLHAASWNINANTEDRTCVALDSFVITAGKTHTAPDLQLIEGSWIEGRLVDARTGEAISGERKGKEPLQVGLYGPSKPRSGAACESSTVDAQGRFRLRVAPGVNYPYLMNLGLWLAPEEAEYLTKGIDVKSGEVVQLVLHILQERPPVDPVGVRSSLPVAAEQEAAITIRRLGGTYKLDQDAHVIEINMVYDEARRGFDRQNKQVKSEEALRLSPAFPRLKQLLLSQNQASDESLQSLRKLPELEVLMIWNAWAITDAGVRHLSAAQKLQKLHLSNSKIGDDSLAVLSQLPALQSLALQGNNLSDAGLKHLAGMRQLRSLWVGMSRQKFTDAGAQHLAGLTLLEELDLQRSQLSDRGIAALKGLKQLRSLHLSGDTAATHESITDASIPIVLGMTRLRKLSLSKTRITGEGLRQLAELPELRSLDLSSTVKIPETVVEEVKKRLPGIQLQVSHEPLQQ